MKQDWLFATWIKPDQLDRSKVYAVYRWNGESWANRGVFGGAMARHILKTDPDPQDLAFRSL